MEITEIPKIGLGTWLLTDFSELEKSINSALNSGYRHIDTAQMYNNEYDIGHILRNQPIPRSELFLTTKIAPMNYRNHVSKSVHESLRRLQTDYLDLVLLHAEVNEVLNIKAYKDLIEMQKKGFIRHIGVSNFSIEGIEKLIQATGVKPYCNQIVCSPTTRPIELENYCLRNEIALTGYSILKPYFSPNPFYPESALTAEEKMILDQLCQKYNVSIGQLLNKWALQHSYNVIPKSSNPDRVEENYKLDFEINQLDLNSIDSMNRFTSNDYQESVKQWENQLTESMLEKGLLYEKYFQRDF